MTVEFDLYFFTREFLLAAKEKEQKKSGTIGEKEIALELGAISCRNTGRKQPIFFYEINELAELIDSGYVIGTTRGTNAENYELPDFDPSTVIQTKVELDDEFKGRLIDARENEHAFSDREAMVALFEQYAPDIGEL